MHVVYQFACLSNVYGTFAIQTKSFKDLKKQQGCASFHFALLYCYMENQR